MSDGSGINQELRKAELLALLYAIIERELSHPPHAARRNIPLRCPRCGSKRTIKRGHDGAGRQRYLCNDCSRSFTAATGNALSSTNIPLETWFAFADCCVSELTLREAAAQCNVCLKTAFYMRKRLNAAVRECATQVKRRLQAQGEGSTWRVR